MTDKRNDLEEEEKVGDTGADVSQSTSTLKEDADDARGAGSDVGEPEQKSAVHSTNHDKPEETYMENPQNPNAASQEEPAPAPLKAKPEVLPRRIGSDPKRQTRIAIIIALIAVASSLIVYFVVRDDSNKSSEAPMAPPSSPFSLAQYLIDMEISLAEDLANPTSSQSKALSWIHSNTKIFNESLADNVSQEVIIRYAFAVVYYALGGESWNYQLNFLNESHICEWNSVFTTPDSVVSRLGISCFTEVENPDVVLYDVSFDQNGLHGTIPDEIRHIQGIRRLSLSFNTRMHGSLNPALFQIQGLQFLETNYCNFGGTIPASIGNLTSLIVFGVANNFLTGIIPDAFFHLSSLDTLILDDNLLTGVLSDFGRLPNLTQLYLEDNAITGELTEGLIDKWRTTMVFLDLNNNLIESRLPRNFFNMESIRVVDLHGNKLFGPLVEVPPAKPSLSLLALYDNALSSTIPSSIGNLASIVHLDLSRNAFTGSLPIDAISLLTDLSILFLGNNAFDHALLFLFPELTNLVEFSMKNANLIGTIPQSFGAWWPGLRLLDLDGNQLSGTIPESLFSALPNLQHLLLNRNALTGTIPSSLVKLNATLEVILLEKNSLTGSLDVFCDAVEVKERPTTTNMVADCGIDENLYDENTTVVAPQISCRCCSTCCHDDDARCNNLDYHVNMDPLWEFGFQRRNRYRYSKNEVPLPVDP